MMLRVARRRRVAIITNAWGGCRVFERVLINLSRPRKSERIRSQGKTEKDSDWEHNGDYRTDDGQVPAVVY